MKPLTEGNECVQFFFIIASAFDKVWREGLIYKSIKLNFPKYIICWLNEFLSNKFFGVRVNESITNILLITAGVPQGAIVSPTLFSLFINKISINYSEKSYIRYYLQTICVH